MKKLALIVLLGTYTLTFAQVSSMSNNLFSDDLSHLIKSKSPIKKDADIEGTVYIDKNYKLAKVAGVAEKWPIRYDAYRDEIEIKKENDIFALKKEPAFNEITVPATNEKIIFAEFEYNKKMHSGYLFEVANTDKIKLYKKQTIIFKKGKEPKTTLEIPMPDRFVAVAPTYYIKLDKDQQYIKLDKKAKFLIESFPNEKEEIKKCLKTSQLNLSTEYTVKQFVKCIAE